jgi:hypothetical protein
MIAWASVFDQFVYMQFEDKMTVEEMPFDEMSLGKVA